MIDYSNEIFTKIADKVREVHDGTRVIGESVSTPSNFPCVTIEEIFNVPASLDSGLQKYADISYRVQVFSKKESGKRAEARQIFSTVLDEMYSLNLICKTYSPTPNSYNSSIYEIKATFEGRISQEGIIYRR